MKSKTHKFYPHYIVLKGHAYALINYVEVGEYDVLPFYVKWFKKKPIKKLLILNKDNEE